MFIRCRRRDNEAEEGCGVRESFLSDVVVQLPKYGAFFWISNAVVNDNFKERTHVGSLQTTEINLNLASKMPWLYVK